MAQQLRALAVLSEDRGSSPSTYIANSSIKISDALFWTLRALHEHDAHTCRPKTKQNKTKQNKTKQEWLTPLIPVLWRQRQTNLLSLRPVLSTNGVVGQPELH